MDEAALQAWLTAHIGDLMMFLDYEASIDDERLTDTLQSWFGGTRWHESGHRFIHLGQDGSGGQFAVWVRPGASAPHPVVVLGSEGGRGVLVGSPTAWAQVLAHGVSIDDYNEPAVLHAGKAWSLSDGVGEDERAEAQEALATYRAAVETELGPLPPFEELTAGLDSVNDEFGAFVDAHNEYL